MERYDIDVIVNDVRIAIDQNINNVGDGVGSFNDVDSDNYVDVDTLSLNETIKSKIVDAVRMIEKAAPTHMLGDAMTIDCNGKLFYYKVSTNDKGYYAKLILPKDYLRLVTFKMEDWNTILTSSDLITAEQSTYTLQRSSIERVRGNKERPIIALVKTTSANGVNDNCGLCIEAYSTDNGKQCECNYLPIPLINENDEISIPSRLYRSIIYAIGYLVSLSFGDTSKAQSMLVTARSLAEIGYDTNEIVQQAQQDEAQ